MLLLLLLLLLLLPLLLLDVRETQWENLARYTVAGGRGGGESGGGPSSCTSRPGLSSAPSTAPAVAVPNAAHGRVSSSAPESLEGERRANEADSSCCAPDKSFEAIPSGSDAARALGRDAVKLHDAAGAYP